MSTVTTLCLSAPTTPAVTTTCYSISRTLETGDIESLTGRLIKLGGTRLVATPQRTLRIDDRDVFLSHDRAVEAVRERMRVRVHELNRRAMKGWIA